MKNFRSIIMALTFLLVSWQSLALAAPDTYIGDAAIYSAIDNGSERPRPNVLFIIDNSAASLNIASGQKYIPTTSYPNLGYNTWTVYAGDNQGNFTKVQIANTTSALENITCATAIVKTSLQQSGTYAGAGSTSYPNLRGGACDTGPTGATYALGNYLNYLAASTAVSEDYLVTRPITFLKKVQGQWISITEYRKYQVTQAHVADATNAPGTGATWAQFWTLLAGTTATGTDTWVSGRSYSAPATAAKTQREIIYDALNTVVDGARYAVNFGAMTYGGNNSGGKVVAPMSDLRDSTNFSYFLTHIPGPKITTIPLVWSGEPVLSSATNRPQAESLYDAGFYFDVAKPALTYPGTQQSITETTKIPDAIRNPCGYNHIILITNGLSFADAGSEASLGAIGDYDGDGWQPNEATYGTGGSHYLDDVAKYLKTNHNITTHTILAFQAADPLVEGAAERGEGRYYNVYDANAMAAALTKLLTSIVLETDTSFVAPVVPASSTNRTISSNRVYLGLFKPQNNRPWLGNLKKYGVSSELALLDKAGAATTDANGDFLPNSKSYWGESSGRIMSIDGLLPLVTGGVAGDGGNVAAGGVGGTLLVNLKAGLLETTPKQAWQSRNIYTWVTGTLPQTLSASTAHRFSPTNTNITATTLAVADAATKDKLINFVAGADGYDDNKDGNITEIRDWVLGDILHSKPLIFSYSSYTEAQESSCPPIPDDGSSGRNRSMMFVGSNDGMIHAFRDCDGKEVWAFIPDNVLPNLQYLRESDHHYFADAAPTAYVHDVNNNNIIETGDKVVLIFGQGRGGGRSTLDASGARGAYYALDVSNPVAPILLWKVDSNSTGYGELGETLSPPRLARVKVGTADKVVAFVGAGYDNNEDLRFGSNMLFPDGTTTSTDTTLPTTSNASSTGSSTALNPRGRGVFAIQIATLAKDAADKYQPSFTGGGTLVWSFVKANDNSQGMDYSIPSDLTILDMDGDGYQDRIYVGDTGGRLWRFDTSSTDTAAWTTSGRIIFNSNKVGGETYTGRKIFYKPTVALVDGIPTLYFGTGDRSHPLNTAVRDRMFAVRDRGQVTADAIDIDNLKDLTLNTLQATDTDPDAADAILADLATTDILVDGYYGWYVDLNLHAGEKVLASALVFNKQAFYTTYAPLPDNNLDVCQVGNLGKSRLYQLDYATAEATQNYYSGTGSNDSSSTYATNIRAKGGDNIGLQREDREKEIGVGIPSGIVTLIDASGRITLMISSSNRVGTYEAPSAKMMSPLYWIQY